MGYAKVNEAALPKRGRKSESKFEATPEWRRMRADLEKGLRKSEALQITLTDEDYARVGIQNRRTVTRFVQKYLDKAGLDYRVKSFHAHDLDFIVVQAL